MYNLKYNNSRFLDSYNIDIILYGFFIPLKLNRIFFILFDRWKLLDFRDVLCRNFLLYFILVVGKSSTSVFRYDVILLNALLA